jgi:hypothetical protein
MTTRGIDTIIINRGHRASGGMVSTLPEIVGIRPSGGSFGKG